ncbi:MAG: hypothetical protein DRQ45_06180 [Gammaproteobacteria bacterium]|nr:MAG: hypothetical protein DRQ45_06180 [Gammaproteobacteria bacterium]
MKYQDIRERLGAQRFRNVMHVSRKFNYVYVANPKAACSTLKLILSRAENDDPAFIPESLHHRKYLPLLTPNKLTRQEQAALFDGTYYRFSFVRHPFKRALSAYTDKILGNKRQKREILEAMGRADETLSYPVSFDDFVTVIAEQDPATLNPHWRPQHLNLVTDLISYDFIGRLENLDADMAKVRTQLKLPDYGIPHKNRKSHKTTDTPAISSATRRQLETLYAEDLGAFSYDSDIELR